MKSLFKQRSDPAKSLVGFVVGDVCYAVAIGVVREIVNPGPLTELPHAPPAVIGVVDHRGEVVPIVNLRTRFGLPPAADPRRSKWILIEVEGRSVGLVVDRVTEVFGAAGTEIREAPSLGGGDQERGFAGVVMQDGCLTFVLEVARFHDITRSIADSQLLALASRAEA